MLRTSAGIGLLFILTCARQVATAPFSWAQFTNNTLVSTSTTRHNNPLIATAPWVEISSVSTMSGTSSTAASYSSSNTEPGAHLAPSIPSFTAIRVPVPQPVAVNPTETASVHRPSLPTPPPVPVLSTPTKIAPSKTTNQAVAPTPGPPSIPSPPTAPATPGTMKLSFVNNLPDGPVYGYLTGTDSTGQFVILTTEGDWYYPSSSCPTPKPIPDSANIALPIKGYGQTTHLLIPSYVSSARLWISHGAPLQFGMTAGGLVEPSAANDHDPNHNTNWGFMEFTFNCAEDGGLFANLSFVDFLGLPLGMIVSGVNNTESVLGPHSSAADHVCSKLKSQAKLDGQPWDQLCKYDDSGKLIRVISPQTLISQNASAFDCYFDEYIGAVWKQYAETPLTIETQGATGTINCTTVDEHLLCDGDDIPFTKPKAGDIFGCASGPFANTGNDIHLAAVPRVCAAFNRATLHIPGGNVQPQVPPSDYYSPPANNFYSRFVHDVELDGKGYAFSYDDVSPDLSLYNTAGLIAMPVPDQIVVYVGGYDVSSSSL